MHLLHNDGHRGVPRIGHTTRHHLVERYPQAVDIGATVHPLTKHRLRTHIGRGPDNRAGHGHSGVVQEASDAEIRQDYMDTLFLFFEDDVARLDVAVDGAAAMGIGQCVGHLLRNEERLPAQEFLSFVQVAPQGFARHKVNHHKVEVVLSIEVNHLHDMGVLQLTEGAGFALEAFQQIIRLGKMAVQDFDGHHPVNGWLDGFVDLSHSTLPQAFQQVILAQCSTSQVHGRSPPV